MKDDETLQRLLVPALEESRREDLYGRRPPRRDAASRLRGRDNPLLEAWLRAQGRDPFMSMRAFRTRERCAPRFAWAIPSHEALAEIAKHSPIVELGAGTGYWAWLLRRDFSVDIVCYDKHPPGPKNRWHHRRAFVPVLEGGARKAHQFPERALFLCWPPYQGPLAEDAIACYEGETVIFIGEGEGGCTATDAFFERLKTDWEEIADLALPQWGGIHDYLTIYRRKE